LRSFGVSAGAGSTAIWGRAEQQDFRSRVRGCLLGGAIGDALGAGIEFDSLDAIREAHGQEGVTDFVSAYGRRGAVTDDTQMTLFTVDGLIRPRCAATPAPGHPPTDVHRAYLRWAATQRDWARTNAGRTDRLARPRGVALLPAGARPACLSGLGDEVMGTLDKPKNPDSKGCGAVMRSAPFGLLVGWEPQLVSNWPPNARRRPMGTHRLSGGRRVRRYQPFAGPRRGSGRRRPKGPGPSGHPPRPRGDHRRTQARARRRTAGMPTPAGWRRWARAGRPRRRWRSVSTARWWPRTSGTVCCSPSTTVRQRLDRRLCGNLLGTLHGETALPPDLLVELEGRETILQLADDFSMEMTQGPALHGPAARPGVARPLSACVVP